MNPRKETRYPKFEILESRIVLNATFEFFSNAAIPKQISMEPTESTDINVIQDDVFHNFELTSGVWSGIDDPNGNYSGNGTSSLQVQRDWLADYFFGSSTEFDVFFSDFESSQRVGAFAPNMGLFQVAGSELNIHHLDIAHGFSFVVAGARRVVLAEPGNQFDLLSIDAREEAIVHAESDLQIEHLSTKDGDLTIRTAGTISYADEFNISIDIHGLWTIEADEFLFVEDPNVQGQSNRWWIDRINFDVDGEFWLDPPKIVTSGNSLNVELEGTNRAEKFYWRNSNISMNPDAELIVASDATFNLGSFSMEHTSNRIEVGGDLVFMRTLDLIAPRGTISVGKSASISTLRVDGATFVHNVEIGTEGTANFSRLHFDVTGNINILESSDTRLFGTLVAEEGVNLESLGKITDSPGTSLETTVASFSADSFISLSDHMDDEYLIEDLQLNTAAWAAVGREGLADIDLLNFNSPQTVQFNLTGPVKLKGNNAAASVTIQTDDAISEAEGATTEVEHHLILDARRIRLAQVAGNLVSAGFARLSASDSLIVNELGVATFGQLELHGENYVSIHEDDSTYFVNESTAGTLRLFSAGSISDAPNASLNVTHNLTLSASEVLFMGDHATNSIAAAVVALTAPDLLVIGEQGDARFGELTFNSTGFVLIHEDDSTHLVGALRANQVELHSADTITDGDIDMDIDALASFYTPTNVWLADSATDVIRVCEFARFFVDESVTVNQPGTVVFVDYWSAAPNNEINVDGNSC